MQLPAVVRQQPAVGALQLASIGEHLPLGALQLAAGCREQRPALCASHIQGDFSICGMLPSLLVQLGRSRTWATA